MAINQELTLTLKAIDQSAAAFASMNKSLNGLKDAALKIGAVLGSALAIRDTINAMDQWATSVHQVQNVTGLAAQDASRLTFAAQALGLQGDDLALSMDRLAKQMFNTHQNSNQAVDVFRKWGIALRDSHGDVLNINTILEEAATRVQQLGNGAAATALEMDLFGRSGGRLHDLLMQGGDGVKQLEAESDQLGTTLNDNTLDAMIKFRNESNVFGLAVDGLKIQMGIALLPILTSVVEQLTRLASWINNNVIHGQQFAGVIKTIGNAFQFVLGIVKEATDRIGVFFDEIQTKGLGGALDHLVQDIISKVKEWLPKIGAELDKLGPIGWVIKLAALSAVVSLGAGLMSGLFGSLLGVLQAAGGFIKWSSGQGASALTAGIGLGLSLGIEALLLTDQTQGLLGTQLDSGLFAVMSVVASAQGFRFAREVAGMKYGLAVAAGISLGLAALETYNEIRAGGGLTNQKVADIVLALAPAGVAVAAAVGGAPLTIAVGAILAITWLGLQFGTPPTAPGGVGTGNVPTGVDITRVGRPGAGGLVPNPKPGTIGGGGAFPGDTNQTSPAASLDDVYAAYTARFGNQPDYSRALDILHMGMTYLQLQDYFFGAGSGARQFATGGIVTRPTRAIVGEAGPEAIIPLSQGGGWGGNITNNIYVSGNIAASARELAETIVDEVGDAIVGKVIRNRGLSY